MGFVKVSVVFTGEASPMANLMLSGVGAFAGFERSFIGGTPMERLARAFSEGPTSGRRTCPACGSGVPKAVLAREHAHGVRFVASMTQK
ncbi:hypothetical protein AB4Y87_24960 [Paenarthrobacter sp. RAF54_2]|uniref:hypothetical protein n=1 Tax=Paenarthrobacter sp. RAF54_2 TaxID=3233061 RepID=UPI003F9C2406